LLSGFIIIDKPAGITSHDVVGKVRKLLGTKRVGHTGTLDPFATGVLPIAINSGTKMIPFLDEGVKRYEAIARLGIVTDTLDITGGILKTADPGSITEEILRSAIAGFTGCISQTPPMFSAIKQNGEPLYKLAREGKTVERKPREVRIYSIDLLEFTNPLLKIAVTSSKGTYIRSLADDIGASLGCGATLQELRRIASGPFYIDNAVTIEQLERHATSGTLHETMITPASALSHLDDYHLSSETAKRVLNGIPPSLQEIGITGKILASSDSCRFRLSHEGRVLAVAELTPQNHGFPLISLKRVFL